RRLTLPRVFVKATCEERRLAEMRRIRWAVIACANRIPWRAVCFQQGLAVYFMLRLRGISSVLYYDVAPKGCRISAHVWVRCNNEDVIGCETAAFYAVLATFPPQAEYVSRIINRS